MKCLDLGWIQTVNAENSSKDTLREGEGRRLLLIFLLKGVLLEKRNPVLLYL